LDQNFDQADYEIIVVNDSGVSLPDAEWQHLPRVKVVDTNRIERCIARNVGAAIAKGKYLHFLDDDDWLLPGALEALWKLSQAQQEYSWLYGGTMLFDRDDQPIINLVHILQLNCFTQVMAGEWIPLQSSLIDESAFHSVGGFNPLIPGIEDVDLARRMALHFDFIGTRELISGVGMGTERSTTNQKQAQLDGREARELILNEQKVFDRLVASADNSYWRGRIPRIYLTSMVWNLSHKNIFTALSRLLYSWAAILSFFPYLLRRDFWVALMGSYQSKAFDRGFSEKESISAANRNRA
jgi:glycosyltransferase involved in cell wall biosynthesis